jgi:putative redox protein
LIADEPEPAGGDNLGPDPYELLLAALGACTSMTIRMYANHKQWPLEDVGVELDHRREHAEDCEGCEGNGAKLEVIRRRLVLTGKLDDAQRARLVEIADRCPVHRTLTGRLEIETELVADEVGRDAS